MRKAFATASSPWNRPPTGCLIEWVDGLKLAISHWSALEKVGRESTDVAFKAAALSEEISFVL